jgi:hypothetical protein
MYWWSLAAARVQFNMAAVAVLVEFVIKQTGYF